MSATKVATAKPATKSKAGPGDGSLPRLRVRYQNDVIPRMMEEFSYVNRMQVPRLERVIINVGLGEAVQNVKLLESVVSELALITGQRPVVTRAKKAIAGFKVRQGMPIGAKVTLRRSRMYEFLDRLLNIGLPRIRDFRGVSPKAFDGRGNYTLGLKEQLTFPEIKYDDVALFHGMDITIVTNAQRNEEAKSLLANLGMPFR